MDANRRSFLGLLVAAAGLAKVALAQQTSPPPPSRLPRLPEPNPENREPSPEAAPNIDQRKLLKWNQKQIQRDVGRLYELAEALKKEIDETDSSEVLSLHVVHQAEEIEKLARHIKNLARG